ncbi:MAG: ABC transporter permease, partial [Pseudobdellovibrionaceae bacterium]
DESFYQHYRFRGNQLVELKEGKPALGMWDVVLGSEVARKLGYRLGDSIVITHGVTRGEGIQQHDDKPFKVTGILKASGTALDTSLYVSLYGIEAVHIDWKSGAAPTKATAVAPESIREDQIKFDQITSFFLRTKSRIETLKLQREINTYSEEPLLAIIPGVTLAELWRGLGYIDQALKVISWMVLAVGLTAMLISLLTGLNERRREMAILRSIGAGPARITLLLVFESSLLTLAGIAVGLIAELLGFVLLKDWLEAQFGLYMVGAAFTGVEMMYLTVTFVLGVLIGLIPAWKASSLALKDGLSVRV